MSYLSILLLGFALSVDACTLSFSYGLVYNKNIIHNSLKLGFFTGLFQAIMPILGFYLVGFVKDYISQYAQLITFIIFSYLGIKFIVEAFKEKDLSNKCLDLKCLVLAGIATSMDVFSAGITLSLYGNKIFVPALIFGLITFINAFLGFMFGQKLKCFPTKKLEILAGVILILLGIFQIK